MTVTEGTVPEEEDVASNAVVGGTAVEEDAAVAAELGEHATVTGTEGAATVTETEGAARESASVPRSVSE